MKISEQKNIYGKIPYHADLCRIRHTDPHFHSSELEMILCLEGHVNLVAGHQKVRINAGEVFSVDFRDIHYLYSDADNTVLLVHIDLSKLSKAWEKLSYIFFACESSHCYPYQKKALNDVKDILLSMAYIQYAGLAASPHLADTLLDIMLKYFNWFNYENQTEQINMELYSRFYRVLTYCDENYREKISISKLADMEHINKNYFSQFFTNTVFKGFSNMIKYIRCYEAEQLLLTTDMPVSEISYACGFSDSKYFYASFKQWFGTTPAKHREGYARYMKIPVSVNEIEKAQAQKLLRQYITKWHIEKVLQM